MVENLIDFLSAYKSSMEYKSLDFDADKPAQYKHLRQEMAKLYADEDEVLDLFVKYCQLKILMS